MNSQDMSEIARQSRIVWLWLHENSEALSVPSEVYVRFGYARGYRN